jgi:hypothetical protein
MPNAEPFSFCPGGYVIVRKRMEVIPEKKILAREKRTGSCSGRGFRLRRFSRHQKKLLSPSIAHVITESYRLGTAAVSDWFQSLSNDLRF